MLTISTGSFSALETAQYRRAVRETCVALRADHPAETEHLSDAELGRVIAAMIETGRELSLADDELGAFVSYSVAYGPRFYRHPAVAALLADPDLPAGERMEALPHRLPSRVWSELAILAPGRIEPVPEGASGGDGAGRTRA